MNVKKLNYLATIACLAILTTGCMPKVTVVDPYDIPTVNEDVGYIAISSICTGYDHATIGIFDRAHPVIDVGYESIYLNCENDGVQYILLKKKPGYYNIGTVSLSASDFSDPYVQKDESYAPVQVKKGRVTYAGRINLQIEYPSGFYIKKKNAYADDIKNMKTIYKNINFSNNYIDVNQFSATK